MWVIGVLADTIAANRKIMQDVQVRVRRMDYEMDELCQKHKGVKNEKHVDSVGRE